MYNLAVSLQVIATLVCLSAILVTLFKKTSSYSNIIISAFFCCFIQNGGYIMELLSHNSSEGMIAVRMEYLGGSFEICLLTFFIFKYCGLEFNKYLKSFLLLEGCVVLFGVWTWEITHIYYTGVDFVTDAVIPHLVLSHGWLYYTFAVTTILELIACIFILVVSIIKTNLQYMRYNYAVLFFVVLIPLLGFLVAILGVFGGYDATPISVAIAVGLFAVAIAGNHVFDVADTAGETILSDMENAIVVINSEWGYEYSNKKAQDLFPALRNYSRGNILRDVEVKNLFDERRKSNIKIENRIFDVSINSVKVRNEEIGKTAILFDITDSKKQIEQMQELMKAAEVANKAKSVFISNVSHEIRTPINVVMGLSEIMLRDHKTPETENYLVNIHNSSNTLLNLISDIIDYASMDSGKMELISDKFDLKKLLSEVVSVYSFRCEQKGIEFTYSFANDVPRYVCGDVLRIRQIITNILTNAVKYTESGSVKYKLGFKHRTDIDIDLIMAVEDTGIGIRREDYEKIFDGMVRADERMTNQVEGTGLGLSITKNLVELMGGIINFKSEVGKGTVFSVVIPVKLASDSSDVDEEQIGVIDKEKPFRANFTAPKARILLVDDSRINLMVAKELLKEVKCEIVTVDSGEKCLDIIQKEHFDLILLDHRMPDMDGIEVYSRMKYADSKCNGIPVIMHTANASSDARAFYMSKGFADFIPKPTTEEQIVSALYKHLPGELIISAD